MKKLTTVLFIATLTFAGLAQAEFDGSVAQSNYVAAVDKQAYLDSISQDEPAAVIFVNIRKGELELRDKDYKSATRCFQAAYDAGAEVALFRIIKSRRLADDVTGAMALEPLIEDLKSNHARAWGYYQLVLCQPRDQVNDYLLKVAQAGRIPSSGSNIWLTNAMLQRYRFLDVTPDQAIEFLDAVDLMLEDSAKTAAVTGKIIDMKNEQKRREQ